MQADRSSFEAYMKFLAEAASDGAPQVLETRHALSLHFNALATQSLMSLKDPDKLVLGYTRTMMGFLLLHPAPARISMIGLGGGSLAKYCHRHLPHTKVVAIEINPEVIALREQFQIPPEDERLEVVCADGAEYVANQNARPDVILVDGFLAHGMPVQLGTADFYAACHARLANTGVLVANFLESDPDIPFYLEQASTAFGQSMSLSLAEDSANYTLFAWKGPAKLPALNALLARARILETTHSLNLTRTARQLKRGERIVSDRASWPKPARLQMR
ncbi:fused MFS/spermidine synthase [Cupriavidus taiwanensis]|uniref:fused MFS/spermidine synthase n=1 Tax=Cupriavidus taiwanensis TaxID=164546 RepID=UPI000E101DFD|nr:fused MFS/spermidine synthase [Cupriavidus taiwanensis]SOY42814.1 Spermidine synthase [Cupriavidus taiwanensis]SOY58918.1 Spermidine synthase [Cupriavidus taiwanensis]SOY80150.1 Spermidine synthase [Cupriavidus taiwanensis]SOZ50990.1 Spermidine synthase [Cupriavidus taiwanensis]SOZ76047.1 Spermidine synthase [Cupriavidus taiwanensis]